MSELKHYDIKDIEAIDDERVKDAKPGYVTHCTRVYIKSEADKMLTELRKQNEDLKNELFTVMTDLAMLQRWRKVSEELPEVGQEVIFLAKYKTDRIRMWLGDYRSFNGKDCVFYTSFPGWGCEFLPSEIIGWLPKPKAPEDGQ